VHQTLTALSFRTFTGHSIGESIDTSVFVDDAREVYTVLTHWRTAAPRLESVTEDDLFEGSSKWYVCLDGDRKTIEERYFTGRDPQTKGFARVLWVSDKCLNRFEP
jgi:hypothetical protein